MTDSVCASARRGLTTSRPRTDSTLTLDPARVVLARSDGSRQLGWGPDTAATVRLPGDDSGFETARLLAALTTGAARDDLVRRSADPPSTERLLDELIRHGLVRAGAAPAIDRVRVHGNGPIADAITDRLTHSSTTVCRSRRVTADTDVTTWTASCVVLCDSAVPDPVLVRHLVRERIPHLAVRLRDGRALVGPFVDPGRSSCLRCADLARAELDPAWPTLAAQLCEVPHSEGFGGVLVAVAFALGQLETAARGGTPSTLGATIDTDPETGLSRRTTWPVHAHCDCVHVSSPRA